MSKLIDDCLQAQMYSLKKFDKSLRGEFVLPGDPHDNETDDGVKAREYLKNLGVVFYRDSMHSAAILLQPDDGDSTPIYDRSGFLAYKSACFLNMETAGVGRWDKNHPERYRKTVTKNGDDFAWTVYNQAATIGQMSEVRVITA